MAVAASTTAPLHRAGQASRGAVTEPHPLTPTPAGRSSGSMPRVLCPGSEAGERVRREPLRRCKPGTQNRPQAYLGVGSAYWRRANVASRPPDGRRGHSRQYERTPNHSCPTDNVTSSRSASHQAFGHGNGPRCRAARTLDGRCRAGSPEWRGATDRPRSGSLPADTRIDRLGEVQRFWLALLRHLDPDGVGSAARDESCRLDVGGCERFNHRLRGRIGGCMEQNEKSHYAAQPPATHE